MWIGLRLTVLGIFPYMSLTSEAPQSTLRRSVLLIATALATLAGSLGLSTAAEAQAPAAPSVCAVTNADAGAFVFWEAVNGANEYVYATRYNNGPERYARSSESSLFLPADLGRVTAMRVAAVSGGATSNGIACSVDGQGGQPPATQPPQTQPPATQPPATQPPQTQPPATQPPATQPPATQPPATQPPATQPPATQPPQTQPPTSGDCSVQAGDIGVDVQWQAIDDAAEYVYAIRYAGNLRYDRVPGTSTQIAVAPHQIVDVKISAVYADGSYSPAVECGSVRTNNTGSSACRVHAVEGAIIYEIDPVANATEYVYALVVDSSAVFYDRVDYTAIKLDIGSGGTGAVKVSAVFADGSYSPAVRCASIVAL